MSSRIRIDQLGAQGDGIAATPKGPVYIPFALPGETVTAALGDKRGDLLAVLEPSPQRVAPPCRHFGICGGCALQHLERNAYLDWKRGKVVQALAARGIEAGVDPIVTSPPNSRRRVVFSAVRRGGDIVLGFNQALTNNVFMVEECPVSLPSIVDALGSLRELAAMLCGPKTTLRLAVIVSEEGLDIDVRGAGRVDDRTRRSLADFALRSGLARLSLEGEIVIEPRKPTISFEGVAVVPPPGAFLQAAAEAEEAMAALVTAHLAGAKRVLDLFAGIGTFALRLARSSEVHAVEDDPAALASLERGFRFGTGMRKVGVERRDLFRRPLLPRELDLYGGLVFDPPRAGAEDQARQIARSQVPAVAAVSCNPATLARDLRILIDGGYRLLRVTPIDQFLWSPHVEAVALLEKKRKRR